MHHEAVRREALLLERLDPPCSLQPGGEVVVRACHEPDSGVAERDQVPRGQEPGMTLVDRDAGDVEPLERTVHEDELRTLVQQPGVVLVLAAEMRHLAGDEDHPVDAPVEQHVDVVGLPERCSAGVAENRRQPGLRGPRLHRLGQRREDRVGELGDEQADRSRRRAPARGDVEQVAHRVFDAGSGLRAHAVDAARDARSRREAHTREGGDFTKRCHGPLLERVSFVAIDHRTVTRAVQ